MSVPVSHRLFGRTTMERVDRYVVWSLMVMFAIFSLTAVLVVISTLRNVEAGSGLTGPELVTGVTLMAGMIAVLVVGCVTIRGSLAAFLSEASWPRMPLILMTLASLVVLAAASIWIAQGWWPPYQGMWIIVVAILPLVALLSIVVPRSRDMLTVAVVVTLAVLIPAISLSPEPEPNPVRMTLISAVGYFVLVLALAASCRASAWLFAVVRELDRARQGAARLAIAEERLRFSRDLHDLVGRSLSAISLKAELTGALLDNGDVARGRTELADVRELAAQAQADMRAVVSSYRRADLRAELAAARALGQAAGVRIREVGMDSAADSLPAHLQEALAWVVREGMTNAVRHAEPRTCAFILEQDDAAVTLTLTNDGAAQRGEPQETGGTGLVGLQERLAQVGGVLHAERDGDTFVLRCELPRRVEIATTERPS